MEARQRAEADRHPHQGREGDGVSTYTEETPVHNPADAERKIEETVNRIAKGVSVVTNAERAAREKKRLFDLAYAHAYKKAEGAAHLRKYEADILTMAQR